MSITKKIVQRNMKKKRILVKGFIMHLDSTNFRICHTYGIILSFPFNLLFTLKIYFTIYNSKRKFYKLTY